MAPTYVQDDVKPEKLGQEPNGEANTKVSLTSADKEAASIEIPPQVRAAFATKIWTILALQMTLTFIVALGVEAMVERPANQFHSLMAWAALSVITTVFLGILRCFRSKFPLNYVLLAVAIIITGLFWGCTKFIVTGYFNLNVVGIVTISLVVSALFHRVGLTDTLAEVLKPEGGVARSSGSSSAQTTGYQYPPKPNQPALKKSNSRLSRVGGKASEAKNQAIADLKASNDGMMRATMLLGIVTWLIGTIVCFAVTVALKQMAEKDIMYGTTRHANFASAGGAAVMSFFMLLFFHFDCDRQMRKCQLDEFMKALININSDIVIIFVIVYAVIIILACNDSSLEMRGGGDFGGGGVEGGAGADAGGVDGGAGGDVGSADAGGADGGGADGGGADAADAGGAEPRTVTQEDLDAMIGADGV